MPPSKSQADVSLSEAVNQQLSPYSAGNSSGFLCGQLLGVDDANEVLTGGLYLFCTYSGGIPQASTASTQGPNTGNINNKTSNVRLTSQAGHTSQQLTNRWSVFSSFEHTSSKQAVSKLLDAYKANQQSFNIGLNYMLSDSANMGFLLNQRANEGDYDAGGDFADDSIGTIGFIELGLGDDGFLQLSAGREVVNTERNRLAEFSISGEGPAPSIKGQPKSDFSYSQTQLAVQLGSSWILGATQLTPSLAINWQLNNFGTHTESGDSGLEITTYDDAQKFLQGIAGVRASWVANFNWGVFAPQLEANFIREFENKAREVEVSFTGDKRAKRFFYNTPAGDNNYLTLSAGGVFILKNGWQVFADIESYSGYANFNQTAASLGVRAEF
ncbi:MAG: autotransporter outer membrane beta-barrel domain-containing protein [Marinagarivorans sp.]